MLYFFLKYLVFHAVLLGWLNWKTGEQSQSFPHSKGLIWTSCMYFWFLTSGCTLLMFSLTNEKKLKSTATTRNQDNSQGRHFGFSSETNRDRFLDVHSGPARGRQVLKDMEHFSLPEAAQNAETFSNGCTAITCSLLHWTSVQLR